MVGFHKLKLVWFIQESKQDSFVSLIRHDWELPFPHVESSLRIAEKKNKVSFEMHCCLHVFKFHIIFLVSCLNFVVRRYLIFQLSNEFRTQRDVENSSGHVNV